MGIVCRLEDDLIHPDIWAELYNQMPLECKEVVDEPPCGLGIGRNEKLGWFIMGSGQGPCLLWQEKSKQRRKYEKRNC